MGDNKFTDFKSAARISLLNRVIKVFLVLVFLVLVCTLLSRYQLRININKKREGALTAETLAYLKKVPSGVNITVCYSDLSNNALVDRAVRDLRFLLKEYAYQGKDALSVDSVDLIVQKQKADVLVQRFGDEINNSVIFQFGDNKKIVPFHSFYNFEKGSIVDFTGEEVVTRSVLDVTRSRSEKIYFTTGHGEMRLHETGALRGLSLLRKFFVNNSIAVDELNLLSSEEIPEDADAIIIVGPRVGLEPLEQDKIREYLANKGGSVILLLDPLVDHGLSGLFDFWGIDVPGRLIVDPSIDNQTLNGDLIVDSYGVHPIVSGLDGLGLNLLFGLVRPVSVLPSGKQDDAVNYEILFMSSPDSWAEKNEATKIKTNLTFDSSEDIKGPLPLGVVAVREAGSRFGITIPESRLIVIGNSDFVSNRKISSFGNQIFVNNLLNWVLSGKEVLNIPSREVGVYTLTLTKHDFWLLAAYFSILPLFLGIVGTIVYIKRR